MAVDHRFGGPLAPARDARPARSSRSPPSARPRPMPPAPATTDGPAPASSRPPFRRANASAAAAASAAVVRVARAAAPVPAHARRRERDRPPSAARVRARWRDRVRHRDRRERTACRPRHRSCLSSRVRSNHGDQAPAGAREARHHGADRHVRALARSRGSRGLESRGGSTLPGTAAAGQQSRPPAAPHRCWSSVRPPASPDWSVLRSGPAALVGARRLRDRRRQQACRGGSWRATRMRCGARSSASRPAHCPRRICRSPERRGRMLPARRPRRRRRCR